MEHFPFAAIEREGGLVIFGDRMDSFQIPLYETK